MKKIIILASLIGGTLLLAGCQKEFGRGGEGRFVASSVAGPGTRAEYSGEGTTEGGLLTWERINWQTGDEIRIWSDAAKARYGSENYSDYKVSSVDVKSGDNTRSQATVENAAANGLIWDGVESACGFWALYPASMAGTATGKAMNLSIAGAQTPSDGLTNAPMVAAVENVTPNSAVTLEFYPAFTAFEITLKSADEGSITLNSFALTSTSTALSGSYTATIAAGGSTVYSCPSYSASNNKVEYTFASGTTINKTKEVTFTILALPQILKNLTLEFNVTTGSGTVTRKLALNKNGSPIEFAARSKHRIYGLAMPGDVWKFTLGLDFEVVEWIDGGTHNIDYTTGAAQATGFQFNQGEYAYANDKVDVNLNDWIITFGGSKTLSEGVVYVQYTITLPENAEWSVVPVDPSGYFKVVSVVDGEESPNLYGTVHSAGGVVKPIILKITPNMASIPSSRPEDYTMILHTFAVVAGRTVSIDTETQTTDQRYDYAKFVIAHNE